MSLSVPTHFHFLESLFPRSASSILPTLTRQIACKSAKSIRELKSISNLSKSTRVDQRQVGYLLNDWLPRQTPTHCPSTSTRSAKDRAARHLCRVSMFSKGASQPVRFIIRLLFRASGVIQRFQTPWDLRIPDIPGMGLVPGSFPVYQLFRVSTSWTSLFLLNILIASISPHDPRDLHDQVRVVKTNKGLTLSSLYMFREDRSAAGTYSLGIKEVKSLIINEYNIRMCVRERASPSIPNLPYNSFYLYNPDTVVQIVD